MVVEPRAAATSALAQRWRQSVAALADASLRAAYLRSELVAAPLEDAALALDELALAAELGERAARDVMAAALPALASVERDEWRGRLRAIAARGLHEALARLLGGPGGDPRAAGEVRTVLTSSQGRPLTLGERRALARRPTRTTLDRLMRDPHPLVVRTLLQTPRLTEDDVVRMAALRPASPHALGEIGCHPRWSLRPRVRLALVCNPATPPAVALPLVPLLRQPELAQLAIATDVPAALRRAARDRSRGTAA